MTLDLQRAAQRRMRRAVITLAALVLVLVAALVVIALRGDDRTGSAPAPAPERSTTADPTPVETMPTDAGEYVAPASYVALPDGAGDVGGLPVEFPRTPEGAVAMAVASARNAWSLDAAEVEAGIRAYASAQYRDEMAASAEDGATGNRAFAGLPEKGPIPRGAALNAWPIGVKWEKKGSAVDVLVLLRVTSVSGAGADPKTTLVVAPGRAIWESGDWKSDLTDPKPLPDPAEIGTARFNEDGWKAIQEGSRL
ncbi:hypothetical protein OH717_34050 (plasmid) [Streptomyces albidoflavus]|uniref:hypothetical protein n=1 Tax=Streptomyces albidoflavus TaxID=1886 RepID=UPI002F91093F|nr:hypothetical protein OH717_34220 [Streptomyces albidoflavus]WTD07625.1 hypothetical protein OH717_34050 [Streptomyces albidoflavus]